MQEAERISLSFGEQKRIEAAAGDSAAQRYLGIMYLYGHQCPKNYVQAYKWLYLAVQGGTSTAKEFLDQVQTLMSPEEISIARAEVSEFISSGNLAEQI